jgi:uncharacterized membrane protein SirB2
MYKGILHTHYLVVTLFLLIYVVKTILLLSDKNDILARFTRFIRIPEIVVSVLFLGTGIYLMTQLPSVPSLIWIKLILVFASIPIAIVGFKKSNKILAALSLVMITASFGIAEISHKKKIKADNTGIAAADGKSLYENNCASCHGPDGRLGLAGAKDLAATPLDEAGIKTIILQGKGLMPAAQVNEQQADAIASYVNGRLKGH